MIRSDRIVPATAPIAEKNIPETATRINIKIKAIRKTIIDVVIPVIPLSFATINIVLKLVVPLNASTAIPNNPVKNSAPINAANK